NHRGQPLTRAGRNAHFDRPGGGRVRPVRTHRSRAGSPDSLSPTSTHSSGFLSCTPTATVEPFALVEGVPEREVRSPAPRGAAYRDGPGLSDEAPTAAG